MAENRGPVGENDGQRYGRIGHRSYAALLLSVGIRAAHQLGAAVFLAIYLLDWHGDGPWFALPLTVVSGGALVFTEWLRHRQLHREVAGLITIGKCLLLGAAIHGLLPPTPVVLLVFLLASLGAHAPKNIRHRLLI